MAHKHQHQTACFLRGDEVNSQVAFLCNAISLSFSVLFQQEKEMTQKKTKKSLHHQS